LKIDFTSLSLLNQTSPKILKIELLMEGNIFWKGARKLLGYDVWEMLCFVADISQLCFLGGANAL